MEKKKNVGMIAMIIIYIITLGALITLGIIFKGKYDNKYNDMKAKYDQKEKDYVDLIGKYNNMQTDKTNIKEDYDSLNAQYEELQSKYDNLYTMYAELEADSNATYETPTNLDEYDDSVTYDNLARTPDDYEGKAIKMKGKVIQVMEGEDETDLRVAIGGDYDKVVFLAYQKGIVEERILEDDYITFYGISYNLYTYESTMGGDITIPLILADYVERN